MTEKKTRSVLDFSKIKIDNLQYVPPPRSQVGRSTSESQVSEELLREQAEVNECKGQTDVIRVDGHELNDQSTHSRGTHQEFIEEGLQAFQKFTGTGDAEQWLTGLLEKFELLKVEMAERIKWVGNVLTGEAIIWYIQHEEQMPTFLSFMRLFLQRFQANKDDDKITLHNHVLQQQQGQMLNDKQDGIFGSLRNQLLLGHIEKLPKFTGRSKQNVSKWLREVNQTMHLLKLSDTEKLFYIPSCLESDAKDWFFDNHHAISSWSSFVRKLLDTFESSSKADIAFNRLRQYQQGLNQDVRQYYFEIMKLCKEANPKMDEASKLQYLKDGLKSSLRFDIRLKNPTTTEAFLEYAQKIEELKSLDDEEASETPSQKPTESSMPARQSKQPADYLNSTQNSNHGAKASNYLSKQKYNNNRTPKPPYRCYRCDGTDHFISQCPHFQQ
ncbi:unnamed protein product [Adineta ricciae]|uniref:Retrotransposon gag domain-containing protein n=1 Tax=Adineta ricciae TaxID=249248 RepID=A0A815MJ72_ADIRI|nr:unnamed protein product [Adineta ricciae]CAF1422299.1 unnamed protein product [Adineta ricciae]